MKTVEEMRDDVLAECEWICPNRDFPANADWGHLMFGYVKYDGDDYEAWFLYVSASIHPISLYARSADQIWIAAYRLLGLSERDAVEDEKSRLLKRYKARIKRLRADDAETHRIQMEVKDERIAELQTRNAALVAALEKIRYEHGYRYTYGDGFGNVLEKRINSVGVAVVNALAANTEKGGVNG